MPKCDPHSLEQLLNVENAADCDPTLVEHLSDCAACQMTMERLAADPSWWTDSRELLASAESMVEAESTSQVLAICPTDPDTSDAPRELDFLESPGHPELLGQLGKYQIESVIGRGGMGIVLKGFDTELNRAVAIKVLAPHLASSGAARQRFSREARAAAAVVHDHVVAIHGIETDGPLPYIVMPYIGGESLHSFVRRSGPLELEDIVRIAMQVAAGLSAAHEQGLVHRDIKPANILLENGFGRVLITDFGLARAADDASITRSGLVAGTPHYMSPEQANGDAVDHRSDLFSLGSVVFFMATGRAPFRGEGAMAVLNAICTRPPISIRQLNHQLPLPLETLVARLLAKDPEERIPSAAALRKLLADYLAHLQNPTQKALPSELRGGAMPRTRRVLAGLICLGVLSGMGVAWMRTEGTSQAVPANPPTAPRVGLPTGLVHPVVADFDDEVGTLERNIQNLQRTWQTETRSPQVEDDWEGAIRGVRGQLHQMERIWSVTSADH